jgi:hypothetical protein
MQSCWMTTDVSVTVNRITRGVKWVRGGSRSRWKGKLGGRLGSGGSGYSTPASRRAFWRIVSLTAAKTRRMFPVSVACVKLLESDGNNERLMFKGRGNTVDKPSYLVVVSVVKIDRGYTWLPCPHPVHLISSAPTHNPNRTAGGKGGTFVFRIILVQRHRQNLLFENIDLVQKQHDTRPRKPRRIHNRAKQGKRFFHAIDAVDFEEDLVVF